MNHETHQNPSVKVGDFVKLFYLGSSIYKCDRLQVVRVGRKWVHFENNAKALVNHNPDDCWFTFTRVS